jgi:hypothetical protein
MTSSVFCKWLGEGMGKGRAMLTMLAREGFSKKEMWEQIQQ